MCKGFQLALSCMLRRFTKRDGPCTAQFPEFEAGPIKNFEGLSVQKHTYP